MVAELKEAENHISMMVPLGKEGDEISYFTAERARVQCMGVDKTEIWEVVNPDLDRFLGFGKLASEVQSLVCGGDIGIVGFWEYLTYLIESGGVEGVLLEGKVKVLVDAINNIYVLLLVLQMLSENLEETGTDHYERTHHCLHSKNKGQRPIQSMSTCLF